LLALDDEAVRCAAPRVLDAEFLAEHTHGFEDFASYPMLLRSPRGCPARPNNMRPAYPA
jgi:hypothetical protein